MATNTPKVIVYAAKFVCGVFDPQRISDTDAHHLEGPVRPGRYATAINVHNPHPERTVGFRKKAVLFFEGSRPQAKEHYEQPHGPGRPLDAKLEPDFGMEIDAADIRNELLRTPSGPGPQAPIFIKGWVVLETLETTPLDVVAVYTAEPLSDPPRPELGLAIEVERVPGTLIP